MLQTGRRRAGALSPITLWLGLTLLFASTASAAVLGIDFGTLNIKAAIVKPGIPLDIVLTKDSKRKEVAAVAFKPNRDEKNNIVAKAGSFPERAYGGDALALQGRLPGEVFPNLKLLLGLELGEEGSQIVEIYKERYPALQVEQVRDLGTTVFKSSAFSDEVMPFSVEELVGMELANIKRSAESMAGKGSSVEDAVITIPAFYTADERRAIVKAAGFAGFQVMGLITDGLAVGLDYAKSRTFPEVSKGEKPEYHLVFDMGAGSTTATVMRFQGKSVKDVGRFNKTVQEVSVLGAGWERMLGGDALTNILMEDFVRKLLSKPVLKSRGTTQEEIMKSGRLMGRFFKEAERARQILSANTETTSSFEEILPDIDLRVKTTRADFEKLTAELADRVENPINQALKQAKLTMQDMNSVILHGGAIRTPFVQSKLEKVVGEAKLRSNVNPDESAVFGAAFKAASLSPSFKVKEIRDSDIAGYATALTYTDKGKERKQPLFPANSPVGAGATTKQVSFKDKEDFAFGFVQSVGDVERKILTVRATNLTDSVQELTKRVGCEKDAMNTKFSIRLSAQHGLPDVVGGSVSCEVDESTKPGSVGDSVKGWLGFGKKKDQEPLNDDDEHDGPVEEVDATPSASTSASSSASSSDAASSSSKAPEPPKKHTETIQLRWTIDSEGNPQPAKDEITRMVDRLKAFDDSDKARYARDEAANVLESYAYFVRDFLENKDYEAVSTKDQLVAISETLKSTRDWMESGEFAKAVTETLKEKRKALKDLVEPIQKRRTEGSSRDEVVKGLKKTLDDLQKGILKIESEAAKVASSIAKSASSMASSATESATAPADPDDLEEPHTTVSAPKSSATAAINPYDSIDISAVQDTYKTVSEWLTEKVAEQAKLKPFEDPVLLVKDMEKKSTEIKQSLQGLLTQAARAKSSAAKPKTSKTKSSKKTKPTADPAAEAEEPVPAEEPIVDDVPAEEASEGAGAESAEGPRGEEPKKFGKPVEGGESIEDMMNWMNKQKPKDKAEGGHDEL